MKSLEKDVVVVLHWEEFQEDVGGSDLDLDGGHCEGVAQGGRGRSIFGGGALKRGREMGWEQGGGSFKGAERGRGQSHRCPEYR